MMEIAGRMGTSRNAKVTPTARASMLVAMARRNIVFTPVVASAGQLSLPDKASLIMFTPIINNSPNAIQWSMLSINCLN